ncbi:MAG TPA: hypothetical protein VI365_15945 [Trebonia sp.]
MAARDLPLWTTGAEFPGNHSGFILRPRAFATRLHEILGSSQWGS